MEQTLYRHLKSPTFFRLLTIHPGVTWQRIEASLWETCFADKPQYEALSYMWRPPGDNEAITIDGFQVSIRRNLWSFLQRVRRQDVARTVWVDALCISQTDLVEKGEQVSIIGYIFGKAIRVLVWVGEHADGSEKLFGSRNFLERLQWTIQPLSLRMADKASTPGQIPMWQTWRTFLNRPYFKRTWIVQEVVVAKELIIFCGDDVSDWERLIASRLSPKDNDNPEGGHTNLDETRLRHYQFAKIGHIVSLYEARAQWRKTSRMTLHDGQHDSTIIESINMLGSYHDTKCEDRRDKVYALLSLATPYLGIRPDYSISMLQLFLRLCGRIAGEDSLAFDTLFQSISLEREELISILQMLLNGPVAEELSSLVDEHSRTPYTVEPLTSLLNATLNYSLGCLDMFNGGGDFRKLVDGMRPKAERVLKSLRDASQIQLPD